MSAATAPPGVTLTFREVIVLAEIIKVMVPDAQQFGYLVALTLVQRAKEGSADLEAESAAFVSLMMKLSDAIGWANADKGLATRPEPTVAM